MTTTQTSRLVFVIAVMFAGCTAPAPTMQTTMVNPGITPTTEQADLPAGVGGVREGDTMAWPIGGWDAVTQRIRLPFPLSVQNLNVTIEVRCWVTDTGRVARVEIIRGDRREIDQAVKEALLASPFQPALKGGVPTGVVFRQEIGIVRK